MLNAILVSGRHQGDGVTMIAPLEVHKTRVVVTGPTVGKTTAVRQLALRGCAVLETDDVVKELLPQWKWKGEWKVSGRGATEDEKLVMELEVGRFCQSWLSASPHGVVFSNLWSHAFCKGMGYGLANYLERMPLGVFRASGEDMTDVSKQRGDNDGSGLPLALTRKWEKSWLRSVPRVFQNVIWIQPVPKVEGVPAVSAHTYLTDVIDWRFSWLGRDPRLLKLDSQVIGQSAG
jgi:hypothetical protein